MKEKSDEESEQEEKNDLFDEESEESENASEEDNQVHNKRAIPFKPRQSGFHLGLQAFKLKHDITKTRLDKKKNTRLYQESALFLEKYEYPIKSLKYIAIINPEKKEIIHLYFTEEEARFLLAGMKLNNTKSKVADKETTRDYMIRYLPKYFNKLYSSRGNLEKRLKISASEKMNNIKPIFTIAIEMDKKLKDTEIVKQQTSKHLLIKKDIYKHIDEEQESIIFDPFAQIKLKENNDNRKTLPKWGVSIKKKIEEEKSDDEDSSSKDQESDEEEENKFNIKYFRKLSVSEEDIQFLKKIEDKNNNKEDNKVSEENNKIDNFELPYMDYIKELFFNKLDDYRKYIMDKCLKDDELLGKIDFEKFICIIEFFVCLFTGIQVKYSIDELGFLNMDFYADESIYMNMAEILHYQVQFQIRDISHSANEEKTINPNLIIQLNTQQYEDFKKEKIEFFPPSTAFIQELYYHFRRYDNIDNYHLCKECEQLFSQNSIKNVSCDSSVFRFIDKVRLILMTLSGILDINYIEKMIKLNSEENAENEEEQGSIFKATMILRNEDVFNEFKDIFSFRDYLCPVITKSITKLDNKFRNIFGEIIGYYYTWVSHYISWSIFPAVLGLIVQILLFFLNDEHIKNYIYLVFLILFLLWGFYYVRNWKKYEKFYNHIWGMDSFQTEMSKIYDENYSKVTYVTFLGLKIPKIDKLSALMMNFISIVLVLISSLFIMMINVGIFKFNNMNYFQSKYINYISAYFNISTDISKYTLPVLIYIAREIISKIFYKFSDILTKLERPTDKEEYDEIITKKRLTLEFVNYNFNLYYIMLYKRMKNQCQNNDCFEELRKQLILILITNILTVLFQFLYKIYYLQKNINTFEKKMKQAYGKNSLKIEKLKFYTREKFTEDNIQRLIIPIIFNFGYVIQFGICCPISFVFVLILVILMRLANAISMIYVLYVKTFNISKGFLVYNNTQHLFVLGGLFSNLCILFYTKNSASEYTMMYKLIVILLVQNGVIIFCNIIRFKSLPFWFRYRKVIKLKYLKKFGVIKNESNEAKLIN